MEKPMTSHRQLRSTVDGLAAVAIGAALMAAAPIGAASAAGDGSDSGESGQAANGGGYEPSETDCVNVARQPGRYAPDDLAACRVTPQSQGFYRRG
jgi:hypothetical protein